MTKNHSAATAVVTIVANPMRLSTDAKKMRRARSIVIFIAGQRYGQAALRATQDIEVWKDDIGRSNVVLPVIDRRIEDLQLVDVR